MHVPLWQVVAPLTHIAPPPHVQVPDVQASARVGSHCAAAPHAHPPFVHRSARAESHVVHIAAPVPHADTLGVAVQTLPVQHPEPHEFASHVQTRLTHSCPGPHAAPAPHVQAPAIEHPSPVDPHVPHMVPAGAHAVAEVSVQTLPAQHPDGHEVALQLHVPPEQT